MPSNQTTNMFKYNFLFWKIFGIWEGRKPSKYYKYYSYIYLFITFICYNILLTLNLAYTPPKIDLIIREVMFYFTEIAIIFKVFTVVFMRSKILEAFDIIDSDQFIGDYKIKNGVLFKVHANYRLFWKLYAGLSNVAFMSIFVPVILDFTRGKDLDLPICKYYFLSDEQRRTHYTFWFIYQSFCLYGHMMYNVNVDSFIAGLLMFAVAHLKLLNQKLSNFKLSEEEKKLSIEQQDNISLARLTEYLRYYEIILKYCGVIQDVLSTVIFFQFSAASIIICVVMTGLILPLSIALKVFLVMYLFAKFVPVFVPGFLGTQISHESHEIVLAAYKSDWIPRSQPFKRSLRLLIERANIPITITGLKMFPLSLLTFATIMKTAYSFFMLIRNFQEQNN